MQRAERRSRVTVLVAACAASVVATMFAMSGVAGATAAAGTTEPPKGKATATLQIIEPNVSVQRAGKDVFKPAKEGQKLRVGDTIQTDGTGFAQVNYTDDSFTRLDVNTTFTIVSLTDDEGNRQIKGSVDSGQTWNRTSALTESETFEQEGAGATAAVTGTAFVVSCTTPQNCTFTSVVDGITLTTVDGEIQHLDPLQECDSDEVVIDEDADLCGAPAQVTLDAILANAWILENLFIDGANGFEGIVIVEDGEVVSVTPTSTPPAEEEEVTPPSHDPPVIDEDDPVDITNVGNPIGGTSGETTGPNDKVSSQDERSDVTFVLQVTSGDHDFYILFTVLPAATFGHLYDENDLPVDMVTHYEDGHEFRFDPIQIEPICQVSPAPTDLEHCFTFGVPENAAHTTYPTGENEPVDYGDGTVRWYGSFTFRAVDEADPTVYDEATVTLEVVENVCVESGDEDDRPAAAVVETCQEPSEG